MHMKNHGLFSDASCPSEAPRRVSSRTRAVLCLAVFLILPLSTFPAGVSPGRQDGIPVLSQKDISGQASGSGPLINRHDPGAAQDNIDPVETQKRLAALNALRHKEMSADTEKLLTLANELKAAMDKTDKDTLSLDVVKKAEQIEKLAKSVKQKMKASL